MDNIYVILYEGKDGNPDVSDFDLVRKIAEHAKTKKSDMPALFTKKRAPQVGFVECEVLATTYGHPFSNGLGKKFFSNLVFARAVPVTSAKELVQYMVAPSKSVELDKLLMKGE